jgi:CheY-like chemotaxis protein
MIAAGATAHALQRAAIQHGMASMRDVAIARVRRGETTLQEIERVIGDNLEDQPAEAGPASILVVNSDPAWRRMARALLEGGGFRVTEAADAVQAMQVMSSGQPFALMVTDLMMPALMAPPAPTWLPGARDPQSVPRLPARGRISTPVSVTGRVSAPIPVIAEPPMPVLTAEARDEKKVDWARFTATVQSAIRRNEH